MKNISVGCNQCKKKLIHPALLDVSIRFRFNVGTALCPMGFEEIKIEGDFCDFECLITFVKESQPKSSLNTTQDLFSRDNDLPVIFEKKNGDRFRYEKNGELTPMQ